MTAVVHGNSSGPTASVHGTAGAEASVHGTGVAVSSALYPRIMIEGEFFYVTSASIKQDGQWRTISFKNLDHSEFQRVVSLIEKVQNTFNNTYTVPNIRTADHFSLSFHGEDRNFSLGTIFNRNGDEYTSEIKFSVRTNINPKENDQTIQDTFQKMFGNKKVEPGDIQPIKIGNREVEETVSNGDCLLDALLKGCAQQGVSIPYNDLGNLRTYIADQIRAFQTAAEYSTIVAAINDIPERSNDPQLNLILDLKERVTLDSTDQEKRFTCSKFADYISSVQHKPYLDAYVFPILGQGLDLPIKVVDLAGNEKTNNFNSLSAAPTPDKIITVVHNGNHYLYLKPA